MLLYLKHKPLGYYPIRKTIITWLAIKWRTFFRIVTIGIMQYNEMTTSSTPNPVVCVFFRWNDHYTTIYMGKVSKCSFSWLFYKKMVCMQKCIHLIFGCELHSVINISAITTCGNKHVQQLSHKYYYTQSWNNKYMQQLIHATINTCNNNHMQQYMYAAKSIWCNAHMWQ